MLDWNWLWVVGELGVSYGFYRWWKSNDALLLALEISPDIDIESLKRVSSIQTAIDYASVHGLVQSNDSKLNSVLTSHFIPDCTGVLHRITIREQKLEKIRNIWSETKSLISDVTRYVPFRLVSSNGNFIRIDKPLEFDSIKDQLEVTHVKFDPTSSSSINKVVGTIIGDVSKGIETQEQMLLSNTPLTGVGRLERRSGTWYLVPHEQWGGMLTRLSRDQILTSYRKHSSWTRIFAIVFGIIAGGTAIYLLSKYYPKFRRQSNRSSRITPVIPRDTDNNGANRLQCVICLDNEIIYSLQPCSHLGLCETCSQQLQARNRAEQLCPICRTPIQNYQRIFLA